MKKHGKGYDRRLHDPFEDKLVPTVPLDLSKIKSIDDLVRALGQSAFTARQVGDAADALEAMARDKDCFVVLTLSGALTVAKMGLVICDLMDHGVVQALVSTGALMAHGLVEATGRSHFRYDPRMSDSEMFKAGYNRVYDSLEPEINLDHVEEVVHVVLDDWDPDEKVCSWKLNRRIGEFLHRASRSGKGQRNARGILKSAFERNVPVFVPAFTDSELGIDLALENLQRARRGLPKLSYDPYLDFDHFAEVLLQAKRIGIFTIGGGVPRNWAQQFGVFTELLIRRKLADVPLKRYHYGVRICPEPVHWGGLSGSTYSEAVSWGKFVPPEEGGRFAEVLEDATVALPLVAGAVLERLGAFGKRSRNKAGRAGKRLRSVAVTGR